MLSIQHTPTRSKSSDVKRAASLRRQGWRGKVGAGTAARVEPGFPLEGSGAHCTRTAFTRRRNVTSRGQRAPKQQQLAENGTEVPTKESVLL